MSKKILNLRSRIVVLPNAFWCSVPQLQNYILPLAARNYSTWCAIQPCSLDNLKLNPWFVTGFTDGEGCFYVIVTKDDDYKQGWMVKSFFEISLKENDYPILKQIKNLFRVGSINYNKKTKSFLFRVSSSKDLKIIIDHFDKFPLITQKRADFELFKKVFNLMLRNQHLTMEGLRIIVAIKSSMNKGQLSDMLKINFPDIVPSLRTVRLIVKNQKIKNPHWLAGFTAGEGCFFIEVSKSNTHIIGFQVKLLFILTQHSRDEQLMRSLIKYFACGRIHKMGEAFDFRVTKKCDIQNVIIPFFKKYTIHGVKALDFADWCEVAEMMKQKKHLTPSGLDQIKKIKARMNSERYKNESC